MPRKKLADIHGQRLRFRAVVERFGEKPGYHGYPEPTLLLKDVRRTDTNEVVTNHLWFTKGVSWYEAKEGDTVEFDARVDTYEKGYVNLRKGIDERESDYKLSRPTKITIIKKEEEA